MRSHDRPHFSVRLWFTFALVMPVALATASLCHAQSEAAAPTDKALAIYEAERALASGQYSQVDEIAAAFSEDPYATLLRARAAIARGRYETAIEWLTPLAVRDDAAALDLGLLLSSRGSTNGGPLLRRVLQHANARDDIGLLRAGRAAHALGLFQQANDFFRDATAIAGNDAEIQTAWGELLLAKHNRADAARSFRSALQGDRRHAPAYVGLARAIADDDPDGARQLTARALALNPSFVPALVLVAETALDDRDPAAAQQWLQQAVAVNPDDLQARSVEAAIAWLADRRDEFERIVAAVLALNPRYVDVFRLAGSHAARHYRFDEAVLLTRRGLELDPDDPAANAELGMHLLRTGDEREARAALERAFRKDPYDAVTFNLLGLLDTLDTFVTVQDDQITLRMHPEEAPVLREHALPLARRALTALAERYGAKPTSPILIEIFPRHDDFAVRTLGLPGMVGALGACFGRVVTLDSPRARPPGTFNWEATLWHELAHVITLQLSNQRVPRWLTEGISVFEERRARADWGREMEVQFVETMNRDAVTPLAELNSAFSRPESIGLAYYQSSLVVELIVERWGDAGLQRLLRAYGEGLDTDAAIERALATTIADLDALFTAAIDRRFADARAALEWPEIAGAARGSLDDLRTLAAEHPTSYPLLMVLGDALQRAGEVDAAIRVYERAAELVPASTGEESPLARIAAMAELAGNAERAASALAQIVEREHTNIAAARRLIALLDPERDRALWLKGHARIVELDPFDSESHTVLGREAMAAGDLDLARRWFGVAVATGPKDAVAAHCDLAEVHLALGAHAEAKRQTLAALEIAPTYARAQDLLLALVDGSR